MSDEPDRKPALYFSNPSESGWVDMRSIEPPLDIEPVELELSWKPNWVGVWALQAALADDHGG
ncbi:hypothetical protein LH128_05905 [Sphingomonas sp. LH128]|uniref:hypothetical protein n=1 Tax=Sphingomonas sp. LH128 TaxID=473781 RepID=UPI00027CA6EC|nr:hypothetical protein [Sphingomonas sp. LH128]EJU14009.1 hypothetical protein LH128_05905 [Sphingomonas sp. LH128]